MTYFRCCTVPLLAKSLSDHECTAASCPWWFVVKIILLSVRHVPLPSTTHGFSGFLSFIAAGRRKIISREPVKGTHENLMSSCIFKSPLSSHCAIKVWDRNIKRSADVQSWVLTYQWGCDSQSEWQLLSESPLAPEGWVGKQRFD